MIRARQVETVVLGGGLTGLAVARALADRSHDVCVVSWQQPGEASTAAAGMLAPQSEADGDSPLFRLWWRALAEYPNDIAALEAATGEAAGFRRCAAAILAFDDTELQRRKHELQWQLDAGLPIEWIDGAELVRRAPEARRPVAAAWLADCPQLEPKRLHDALTIAANRHELRVQATERPHVALSAHGVIVTWQDHAIHAERVIVCAGAWTVAEALPNGLRDAVHPMRGQLIEIDVETPTSDVILIGAGGYLVPRGDGRVVIGSTMERVGFDPGISSDAATTLLSRARSLWPRLAGKLPRAQWSGLRPATRDGLPLVGVTHDERVWMATGAFRNGVLLCFAMARLIADGLADPTTLPRELSPRRFDMPCDATSRSRAGSFEDA